MGSPIHIYSVYRQYKFSFYGLVEVVGKRADNLAAGQMNTWVCSL